MKDDDFDGPNIRVLECPVYAQPGKLKPMNGDQILFFYWRGGKNAAICYSGHLL